MAGLHTRAGFSELRIGAATGLARYQYYNGRVLNMVMRPNKDTLSSFRSTQRPREGSLWAVTTRNQPAIVTRNRASNKSACLTPEAFP